MKCHGKVCSRDCSIYRDVFANVVVEKDLPDHAHLPVSVIICVVFMRWTYGFLNTRILQCVCVWLSFVKVEGLPMTLGLAPNASNQGLQHFRPPL